MRLSGMNGAYLFGPFEKHPGNPILAPQGETWEAKDVFNPAAVVKDGKVYLLYRAEDRTGIGQWNGTSRIGLAVSDDGVRFTRFPEPVLVPTEPYELPGGCEDPRVTQIEDRYVMTYTAYDGQSARLCLATSKDLVHWEKHGVLFPEWTGGETKVWSKSGAICPQKINGKYIMYFGDSSIWLATSDDGIHWVPEEEPVLTTRPDPGAFDSVLVEPGPPPLVTEDGILLLYNAARRIDDPHHPGYGKVRYSVGQVLFSKDNPREVLWRSEMPFLEPETADEETGQVDHVVFVEGLVAFQGAWFLYYGMADSKIGVAIYRPQGLGVQAAG